MWRREGRSTWPKSKWITQKVFHYEICVECLNAVDLMKAIKKSIYYQRVWKPRIEANVHLFVAKSIAKKRLTFESQL